MRAGGWALLAAAAAVAMTARRNRARATAARVEAQGGGAVEYRVSPIEGARLPVEGKGSYLYPRTASHLHRGIDLPEDIGTPVRAAAQGLVAFAARSWRRGFTGYGRHVIIAHSRTGPYTLYAHLDRVDVAPGQHVDTGQLIGTVGDTRFSRADHEDRLETGPELHFEVAAHPYPMESEEPRLDPIAWLEAAPQPLAVSTSKPRSSTSRTGDVETSKTQLIRKLDVWVLAPAMVLAGLQLMRRDRSPLGIFIALAGLGTAVYNDRNYRIEQRRLRGET